jgi:hypothetical protein
MEMMVALGAGTIILAAVVATAVCVGNTMVAVGNYNDLNKASRQTLDRLSRDVRNASSVGNGSTTSSLTLTNTYNGTTIITYAWDGSNQVTRTVSSSSSSSASTVLTNCDTFSFAYYQRNPTNNLTFVSTTNPAQIKLVSVSWRCSRQILGAKLNTESVQTANVVMRN